MATTLSANHAGRLVEAAEAKPGHTLGHRTFIPEYTQELRLDLKGCVSNGSLGCPVHLTMGSATLLSNFQKVLACPGPTGTCHLLLPSLPWGRWIQVTAKSLGGPGCPWHSASWLPSQVGCAGRAGRDVLPPALDPHASLRLSLGAPVSLQAKDHDVAAPSEQPEPVPQRLRWPAAPEPRPPRPRQEPRAGQWLLLPNEVSRRAGRRGCGVCAVPAPGQCLRVGTVGHALSDAAVPRHRHGRWGLPHPLPAGQ